MDWSDYLHLIAAFPAALALLGIGAKCAPALSGESRRRTAAELALLAGITALGLFVIFGTFYGGSRSFAFNIGDSGSDTIEQYVPFYAWLIGSVRDGSISLIDFWTFDFELGVNAATFQQWMYDPFNLVLVPLGLALGDAQLSLALVITHSVKIALSVFLFDHLLTRYCDTPLARILGSVLYGFCGFMLVNGQHYWLGSVFPVFTFAMLMFELYLEKTDVPRFLGVICACAILLAWSPYLSFMVLLFAAIYLLLRIPQVLERTDARTYLATIAKLAAPVFIGILIAGFSLVPYANFLLGETVRTSSDVPLLDRVAEKLASPVPLDWVPAILSRMVGSGLINTGVETNTTLISAVPDIGFEGSFVYEFYPMGFSAGVFILLSQFYHWAATEAPRKTRLLVAAATALIALYCLNQFLPTVFTFMVRLQYRSIFVLALPICCAMALGFEKRVLPGSIAWRPLLASVALTLAVLVWSLVSTFTGRLVCLYYLAATASATALLAWLARRGPQAAGRNLALIALVALVASTSIVDGFFTSNSRHTVPRENFPLSGADERGEDTLRALAYLEELDNSFYRVDKTYSDWVPLNDSLIQRFASASAYNSSADGDVDRFYRQLWREAISTWAVYSQGFKNAPDAPEVLQLLDVKYVLADRPLDFTWCELLSQVGDVYVYRNTQADSIASVRQRVVSESEADALASSAERRALLAESVIVPDDVARELEGALGGAHGTAPAQSAFYETGRGRMEGTIAVDADSVACLAIPQTGTWHISVDGVEVETFTADYGFIGFELSAGAHEVTATYELAGSRTGLVMSAAGIVLAAAGCAAMAFLGGRKREENA